MLNSARLTAKKKIVRLGWTVYTPVDKRPVSNAAVLTAAFAVLHCHPWLSENQWASGICSSFFTSVYCLGQIKRRLYKLAAMVQSNSRYFYNFPIFSLFRAEVTPMIIFMNFGNGHLPVGMRIFFRYEFGNPSLTYFSPK